MSGRLPVVESAAFVLSLSTLIEFPLPLNSLRYGVQGIIFLNVNAICAWPSLETDFRSLLLASSSALRFTCLSAMCCTTAVCLQGDKMTILLSLPLTLSCLFSFPHGFLLFCSHAMLMDHLQLQVSIPALPVNVLNTL